MSKKNRAKMPKLPPANRTPRERGPAEFERYPEASSKFKLFTEAQLKHITDSFKIPNMMMEAAANIKAFGEEMTNKPPAIPPRPEYDRCGTTTERHTWNGSNVCRKCGIPVGDAITRTRAAQAEWDKQYGQQTKTPCERDGHEWIGGVCGKCGMSTREAAFQKSQSAMKAAFTGTPTSVPSFPQEMMTTEAFARHLGAKAEYELTDIVHHIVVTPKKEPRNLSVTLHYDPARLGITPVEACMEIAGFMSQFDVVYEPLNVPCKQWAKETTYSKACDQPPTFNMEMLPLPLPLPYDHKDFTFTSKDMTTGEMKPSFIPFFKS